MEIGRVRGSLNGWVEHYENYFEGEENDNNNQDCKQKVQ